MFTLIWFLNIFEHSNSSSSNLTISSAATSWTYARGPTNIRTYDWRDPRSSQPDSSEQAWTRSRRNQSFCTGHRRLEFCRRRNLQTFPHPVLRSFRFSEKNLGGPNFVNTKIQKQSVCQRFGFWTAFFKTLKSNGLWQCGIVKSSSEINLTFPPPSCHLVTLKNEIHSRLSSFRTLLFQTSIHSYSYSPPILALTAVYTQLLSLTSHLCCL